MNKKTVEAINDGCLQIEVDDPKAELGRMFWTRSYYVLPLEVSGTFSNARLTYQAKRFFREIGKDKKTEKEIIDSKNPVFAGQVFAEMLAGICHEEYYRYSDQEVFVSLNFTFH